MLRIKSLQQRLVIFLLLPVAVFIAAMGLVGYFYIRDSLFKEWQEAAILRLERAAHTMDMLLREPLQWMQAFAKTGGGRQGTENRQWILKQLQSHPGVSRVELTWRNQAAPPEAPVAQVSPPQYFYPQGQKAVGLKSELLDAAGRPLGRLEIWVTYDYLMQDLLSSGWMQSNMACLVNDSGVYLAHTNPAMQSRHCLGETQNPLELAMRQEMAKKTSGTILGGDDVIGFYQLHQAPWVIMLHARASQILAPIQRFRLYYLAGGLTCLFIILLLIRLGVGPLVSAIRMMSRKAGQVARGEYGEPLPVTSRDEIGQLTLSFNQMMAGLQERDFIRNTFGRYMDEEIARDLLQRPEAARLGGEKRQVVILFSDIRGFTPLAETLSPEATIHLINRHFSRMIEVIHRHRGIIVDFLGDAVLAFFDPLDGPLAPVVRQAVQCGLEMQAAQEEANRSEPNYPALPMGVGLHAGEVVVGNIGSESRAKYGIMGAAVNLTHRIQGQAQGGEVVISDAVYRLVEQEVAVKREFRVRLKGVHEEANLYVVDHPAAPGLISPGE
jgi:class 3 adenylate cyclase